MKIRVRDNSVSNAPVGEMMPSGEVGSIAEMTTDPAKLADLVPVPGIAARAQALIAANSDEHPEFPVIRVEEGWSNSRRLWPAAELVSIAEQVNTLEPVGHLGHIPDDQAAFAFPEPQTTWIGAVTRQEPSKQKGRVGEMVTVAYFGGYNHPGAKVRGYIKNNAVRGISWWGNADLVPIPGKGVEVKNFTLKALDWARKLAEGMPTSQLIAVTGEMESHMDKELSQVTPDEFKKENPNGYSLLVAEITADKDKTIGEMEAKITAAEADKSLLDEVRSTLRIKEGDDLLTTLANAMSKLGEKAKATLDAAVDAVLAEKVPDEQKRALVKRLLPVGEMESKLADAKPEDAQKLVGEMVDETFNTDDTIKGIVSEMAPPVVRRREELRNGSDSLDGNAYVKRERVTLS